RAQPGQGVADRRLAEPKLGGDRGGAVMAQKAAHDQQEGEVELPDLSLTDMSHESFSVRLRSPRNYYRASSRGVERVKSAFIDDYGGTENLRIGDAPKPQPGPKDVLVKVEYAGLRWGDVMQRNGLPSRARP